MHQREALYAARNSFKGDESGALIGSKVSKKKMKNNEKYKKPNDLKSSY